MGIELMINLPNRVMKWVDIRLSLKVLGDESLGLSSVDFHYLHYWFTVIQVYVLDREHHTCRL